MDLLDALITKKGIANVIKGFPTSKDPARILHAEELSLLLLQMYWDDLDKGNLPPTLAEALISLILKKDKDPQDCRSYRPISSIGCHSKILSKILAVRIDKVINSLIHLNQIGFV